MWDFFKNVGHILQNVGNVGPLGTLQQQLPIFRHVPSRSQGEKKKMCLDGENKFRVC